MDRNEKWPTLIYQDKEYMTGPDNDCFYRHTQLGICVGPVEKVDSYGNKFCYGHFHGLIFQTKGEYNE